MSLSHTLETGQNTYVMALHARAFRPGAACCWMQRMAILLPVSITSQGTPVLTTCLFINVQVYTLGAL